MSGNESQGWLYGKKRFWVNFWFCSTSKLLINLNFFAMERKFFLMIALVCAIATFTSCQYDDGDLWKKVNSLEEQVDANKEDIATLTSLIEALNKGKMVVTTTPTANGYTLTFSDGSTIEITNGKDGDSFFVSIVEQDGEVVITLADGRVIRIPVANYELRVLTFEDEDYMGTEDNAATYWSDFIPTGGQYGSGHGSYSWWDEGNTELLFYPVMGDFGYYAGHAGISNYVGTDWENEGNYMYDIQAYNVTGGHSGTNFNTHFGYVDETSYGMNNNMPSFEFDDGVARVIDHMWVTNTTYVYNQLQAAGFGSTYVLSDESTFKIVAYGYASFDDEEPVAETEFYLLDKGKKFVTEWTKWDLSSLGKVVKVAFNLVGSDDMVGDYGLAVPGYFAYDDVAVRFE